MEHVLNRLANEILGPCQLLYQDTTPMSVRSKISTRVIAASHLPALRETRALVSDEALRQELRRQSKPLRANRRGLRRYDFKFRPIGCSTAEQERVRREILDTRALIRAGELATAKPLAEGLYIQLHREHTRFAKQAELYCLGPIIAAGGDHAVNGIARRLVRRQQRLYQACRKVDQWLNSSVSLIEKAFLLRAEYFADDCCSADLLIKAVGSARAAEALLQSERCAQFDQFLVRSVLQEALCTRVRITADYMISENITEPTGRIKISDYDLCLLDDLTAEFQGDDSAQLSRFRALAKFHLAHNNFDEARAYIVAGISCYTNSPSASPFTWFDWLKCLLLWLIKHNAEHDMHGLGPIFHQHWLQFPQMPIRAEFLRLFKELGRPEGRWCAIPDNIVPQFAARDSILYRTPQLVLL